MLKLVYADTVVTLETIYKWFDRFRSENKSIEDEKCSGSKAC